MEATQPLQIIIELDATAPAAIVNHNTKLIAVIEKSVVTKITCQQVCIWANPFLSRESDNNSLWPAPTDLIYN